MAVDSVINGDQYAYGSNGKNNGSNNSSSQAAAPSSAKSASNGYGDALAYANAVSDYMDAYNQSQTDAVNAFNAKEAQKNRDWQEYMAKNAHQFEVEDLIKAGLNPVLSAGGQGAFVGSGAVASGQKAVADNTRAQAAMALLNNALYSSGYVAAQTAKGEAQSGNSSAAKATWKDWLNYVTKWTGLAIAGTRTFISFRNLRNSAKAVGAAGSMIGTSTAYQMYRKRYYSK